VVSRANSWTYISSGNISSVSPTAGQVGNTVTIFGSRLFGGGTGVSSVTLAGVGAIVQSATDNQVVVTVVALGSGRGDVVVTGNGGAVVRLVDGWAYSAIDSVTPASGQRGTIVTIRGFALFGGGQNISSVVLAGNPVAQVLAANDTIVVVQANEDSVGGQRMGDLVLTADNGKTTSRSSIWTYRATGQITAVTPTSGQSGTYVTLQGTNLFGYGSSLSTATLAGVSAEILHANSSNTRVVLRSGASASSLTDDIVLTADTGATVISPNGWHFVTAQSISGVSPATGQIGTRVTIDGVSLRGGAASTARVLLAGLAASAIEVDTDAQIVVVASSGAAGLNGSVVVVASTGATVTSGPSAWQFVAAGTISNVVPLSGQFGTLVTISGQGLRGNSSAVVNASLNGVFVSRIISESDGQVVAVAGDSQGLTGTGDVVLYGSSGSVVSQASGWSYITAGAVAAVVPSQGQLGTWVEISGSDLLGGGSTIVRAYLANVPVTLISRSNNTHVLVRAAAGSGSGSVRLVSDTNATVIGGAFSYNAQGAVTLVTPSSGQLGTQVAISGSQLLGGGSTVQSVTFGTVAASSATYNGSHVLAVVGAGGPSTVQVVDVVIVSNTGAIVSGTGAFTFVSQGAIAAVTPAVGQVGTVVNITGQGLLGGGSTIQQVQLAGVDVLSIVSSSNTLVRVVAAAGGNASGEVLLIANTGAIIRGQLFSFVDQAVIAQVEPTSGRAGTRVQLFITNRNLLVDSPVQVLFGIEAATNLVVLSASNVSVVASASVAGATDVTVVFASGARTILANGWTYVSAGRVDTISPAQGHIGTRVTVVGVDLLGGGTRIASATFATFPVESVLFSNETVVVVSAGASNGTYSGANVRLVADTGATVSGQSFTYTTPGAISSVVPASGQYGTRVTINGSRFIGDGSIIIDVLLAGVSARQMFTSTDSFIIVEANASSASSGNVVVVNDAGTRVTSTTTWSYMTPGSVVFVQPASGQRGTMVTVSGFFLRGSGANVVSVTLAGVPATINRETDFFVDVQAAHGAAGTGSVVLTSNTGATVSRASAWTYLAASSISSVSPSAGALGTRVTINGTNLLGGGATILRAVLAGTPASIILQSDSMVVVQAGFGTPQTGDVVLVADTGASSTANNSWSYIRSSDIYSVSPQVGQGGSVVTITGFQLLNGGSSFTSIRLAGVEVAHIVSQSSTQVVVVAGPSSSTNSITGDVVLQADSGPFATRIAGWTYAPAGSILSVFPTSGQFGTRVTLTGQGLLLGASVANVTLAGTGALSIVSSNETTVVIVAGVGVDNSAGNVSLFSISGAIVQSPSVFTYLPASTIASVLPSRGVQGTIVSIVGQRLLGGGSAISSVLLASTPAIIRSGNDTLVVVEAQPSSSNGTGHVQVVSNTGALTVLIGGWTYDVLGLIALVTPNSGQVGTFVTIRGNSLLGGGTSITEATLSGTSAIVVNSTNSVVVVRAQDGSAGTGDVKLVSNTGALLVAGGAWTYNAKGVISSRSPSQGQFGTRVTIVGSSLRGSGSSVVAVLLAGVPAAIVSEDDATVIVSAGAGTTGTGDIMIVADSGAQTVLADGWTYFAAGNVTSVSPLSGQFGTLVTLTGSTLLGGGSNVVSATLAGVAATVVYRNASLVLLEAGASAAAQTGPIVLTSDTGSIVSSVLNWSYVPAGQINAVSPSSGQQGTIVTIVGTYLLGGGVSAQTVFLGPAPATWIDPSSNDTVVVAIAGFTNVSAATVGNVTIVANTGARVSRLNGWTTVATAVITDVSPARGQWGTFVTISGQNLLGGGSTISSVVFAGVDSGDVVASNQTTVVVRAPASAGGSGAITVVANTGAFTTLASGWTFETPSVITQISPNSGQFGTLVTITGSRFFGSSLATTITQVLLGGIPANIVQFSDSTVVVSAADSGAVVGAGHVRVVGGSGALTQANLSFTYLLRGAISLVTPNFGQYGTRLTITGSRLRGGGSSVSLVQLAGANATILGQNDTFVEVVSGPFAGNVTGDVVLVANTGAVVASASAWTFTNSCQIGSVSPLIGQEGTLITITGTGLRSGGTHLVAANLGGFVVSRIVVDTDTLVVLAVGPGHLSNSSNLTVDIEMTANTDPTCLFRNAWTYGARAGVTSVSPASGQRGTRVTIAGFGLRVYGSQVTNVTLAGVAATILSESDSQIVVAASTGPSLGGAVSDIVITSDLGGRFVIPQTWTYIASGRVLVVSPSSGQLGTIVQVSGLDMCGGGTSVVNVTLAGVAANITAQQDCNLITVVAPDYGANVTGDVAVISNTGAISIRPNSWTFVAAGFIQSIRPSAGQAGDQVTITGLELFGGGSSATVVTLAGVPASITTNGNRASLVITVIGGGSGTGDVVILGDTGVIVRLVNGWTFSSITSVTPSSGQVGTTVTITGTALLAAGTNVTGVTLAGVPVASVRSFSNTSIVVVAASRTVVLDQTGPVVVQSNSGQSVTSAPGAWTYKQASAITGVFPTQGQTGAVVTITGARLAGYGTQVQVVTLAGVAANIMGQNGSSVVVIAGNTTGPLAGDVVVTADTGATATWGSTWSYVAAGSIQAVSPAVGQRDTLVTITGSGLLSGAPSLARVLLGGVSAVVVHANDTTVVVSAGSSSGANADRSVVVESLYGTQVQQSELWTYVSNGAVNSFTPSSGHGGTRITISGTAMLGAGSSVASATVAGVSAAVISSSNETVILAAGSANITSGTIVLVANTGATIFSSASFTYLTPGVISSLSPSSGQVGTLVTIRGSGLLGGGLFATNVTLGSINGIVISSNDTTVVFEAAAGSAGFTDVTIISNTFAAVTASQAWLYLSASSITSVVPGNGTIGTFVTVHGTGLLAGGQTIVNATLAGSPVLQVLPGSNNTVVVLVASASLNAAVALTGDIVLLSNTGSRVVLVSGWTYLISSEILQVSPSSGNGGTIVNIFGNRLLGGGQRIVSASFNGVPARAVVFSNETVVQLVAASNVAGTTPGTVTLVSDIGSTAVKTSGWAYVPQPTITAIVPNSGQVGTRCTISGTNLLGGASQIVNATLNGVTVQSVVSWSDTEVVVISGDGAAAAAGIVVLVSNSGSEAISAPLWSFITKGSVLLATPSGGVLGTRVVVTGQGLLGGGSSIVQATLAGIPVENITSSSETNVTLVAGNGTSGLAGHVVLIADTGATSTGLNLWTFGQRGTITAVTPNFGQLGTVVEVTGSLLAADGSTVVAVLLAGIPAVLHNASSTRVIATAAHSSSAMQGDVVLISETGGRTTLAGGWTYQAEGQVIGVIPSSGMFGTTVIIYGSSLRGHGSRLVEVSLVGQPATILDDTDTLVRVVANEQAPATGDVVLTADSGAVVRSRNAWRYITAGNVTAVSPSQGQAGTVVDIVGFSLLAGATRVVSVTLAGIPATIVNFSNTAIRVVANRGSGVQTTGAIVIMAETNAMITAPASWTYVSEGQIRNVAPSQGQHGSVVTISGANLFGGGNSLQQVTLAGVQATILTQSNTTVTVQANPLGASRLGDVVLLADTGALISLRDGFQYAAPGVVGAVSPPVGQVGTAVTITGSSLLAGGNGIVRAVLDGVSTQAIVSSSNTQVVVVANASSAASNSVGSVTLFSESGAFVSGSGLWSYLAPSSIGGVAPPAGQAGTFVTVTGVRLLGGGAQIVNASLVGVNATVVQGASNSTVVLQAQAGSAGTGHVILTADTGARTTLENGWQYLTAGQVASVQPSSGQYATLVSIRGSGLLGGGASVATVTLGGVLASLVSGNDTDVVVTAGNSSAGQSNVDVVITANTGAVVRSTGTWTYLAPGSVTAVVPGFGQVGTLVTIGGQALLGGGSQVSRVTLNGVQALRVVSQNNTQVVVEAANSSGLVGSGSVVVVADSGAQVSGLAGFEYRAAGAVSGVSPSSGQIGTRVTISGTALRGHGGQVMQVTLDGVAVQNITAESDTSVQVVAARGAAGSGGDVVLTSTSGARVTGSGLWTYLAEGSIAQVQPSAGQEGTIVSITGTQLLGGGTSAVLVTLGGVPANIAGPCTDTVCVVAAGANGAAGMGDVKVVSNTGSVVSANASFTYTTVGQVDAVVPNRGQLGTLVSIVGRRLLGGGTRITSVQLGNVGVRNIEVGTNDSLVVVRAGLSGSTGVGNVTLVSDSGAVVVLVGGWIYETASSIASVSPGSGQIGTLVTIQGSNLLGVSNGNSIATVTLANATAQLVRFSASEVVVAAGRNGSLSSGDVVLTADSGAETVQPGSWNYLVEGAISDVQPSSGQIGTVVTIDGSGLLGGGTSASNVSLGGVQAAIVSWSNTRVVVVARDAGTNSGAGSVEIVSNTGAVVTRTASWTHTVASNITLVAPSVGQVGTVVTISGTNLRGQGSGVSNVSLAGVWVTSISSESDTHVVVVAGRQASSLTGHVVVIGSTGATATLLGGWQYGTEGSIVTVTPSSGQVGTRVTISGTALRGYGGQVVSASLVGVAGIVRNESDTSVIVEAADGPGTNTQGPVVLTADSGAVVTAANSFTYLTPGFITDVSPSSGVAGTVVTILGVALCGGGNFVQNVSLAGFGAIVSSGSSCGRVVVTSVDYGANVGGAVLLTADTGAVVSRANSWTYISSGNISSVSPTAGQVGNTVTIFGSRLFGGGTGVSSVTLAGVGAIVQSATDNQVVVTVVALGSGRGDVVVTGNGGAVVRLVDGWAYSAIDSVTPASGQRGTIVTIRGFALFGGGQNISSVVLAGNPVAQVLAANDTIVVVQANEDSVGGQRMGDLVLTADNGKTTSRSSIWTYRATGQITAVTPTSGQSGTYVTLQGTNLFGYGSSLSTATLAGVSAEILHANSSNTRVVLRSGASASSLTDDIVLTADTGATVISPNGWHFVTAQSISGVSPATGQIGTRVTIDGVSLRGGAASTARVLLAGLAASAIEVDTDAQIVVVASSGAAGLNGSVVVVASTGATVTSGPSAWQFVAAGTISNVVPLSGQFGTLVTISGQGLRGNSSAVVNASLNGVFVSRIISESDGQVVAVAGDSQGLTGTGDVVLYGSSGSVVSQASGWSYITAGAVAAVVPSQGQLGTWVEISGSDLLGGGSTIVRAYLANVPVTLISRSNNTHVLVRAAAGSGSGSVRLVSDTNATVIGGTFSYNAQGAVTLVTPSSGQLGTQVAISGSQLLGGGSTVQSVTFGTVAASSATYNGSHVLAVVGAGGPSTVQVVDVVIVSNTGAIVSGTGAFTFVSQGAIAAVTPAVGQVGTVVNITGQGLLGGGSTIQQVQLAGVDVLSIVSSSNTLVRVVAAAAAASAFGAVRLVSDIGSVVEASGRFAYLEGSQISGISPTSGREGTRVTVSGSVLLGYGTSVTHVDLGSFASTSVSVQTNSSVVFTAVAGSGSSLAVRLVGDTGAFAELPTAWTYVSSGGVNSVTPSTGTLGTLVTIVGIDLLGGGSSASSVSLAGVPAERVVSANDTMIVVAAGLGNSTSGGVSIVADTGALLVASNVVFAYSLQGEIASFVPSSGQFGTFVTISGARLLGGGSTVVGVSLAGIFADVVSIGATTIVVRARASNVSSGPVIVTSDTASRVVSGVNWQYMQEGRILQVTPTSGQSGTEVLIIGQNLLGYSVNLTNVTLAGIPATITQQGDLLLRVVAGASNVSVSGDIVLTGATGATIRGVNLWQYVSPSVITLVDPPQGQLGTVVTLSGNNLLNGGSRIQFVSLSGIPARIVSSSETQVVVVAASNGGVPDAGDVIMISDNRAIVTLAGAWTYLAMATIDSVAPLVGQEGAIVTLTGTSLLGGGASIVQASLAGIVVSQIISQSNTQVVVVAAYANQSRTGDVVLVSTTGARATRVNGFQYAAPGVLGAVSPPVGQVGTAVTITGSSLLAGGNGIVRAVLDGVSTQAIVSSSNTQVVVVANASSAASNSVGSVTLFSESGAFVSGSGLWSYLAPSSIGGVAPPAGQAGTFVTVTGVRLLGGGAQIVNASLVGVNATVVQGASNSTVVLQAQAGSAGTGHVILTADTGARTTLENGWQYLTAGQVASVQPSSGQYATLVSIRGSGLLGGGASVATVTLGGVLASLVSGNDTDVVVTAGNSSAGQSNVDVVITANTGAVVRSTGTWTYLAPGSVTAVVPGFGQVGTLVTIGGQALLGGGSQVSRVTLNGVQALRVVSQNNTQVVVEAANSSGLVGSGSVVVVADSGAQVSGLAGFEYRAAGAVSGVSPSSGQIGTRVTISGTALRGHGGQVMQVTLDGVAVQNITAESDTSVQVVAARGAAGSGGDVVLTSTSGARVTGSGLWTYLAEGSIAQVQPSAGQEGTIVSITGTQLLGGGTSAVLVTLGGVPANIAGPCTDTVCVVAAGANGAAGMGRREGGVEHGLGCERQCVRSPTQLWARWTLLCPTAASWARW
jgi:mucin-19